MIEEESQNSDSDTSSDVSHAYHSTNTELSDSDNERELSPFYLTQDRDELVNQLTALAVEAFLTRSTALIHEQAYHIEHLHGLELNDLTRSRQQYTRAWQDYIACYDWFDQCFIDEDTSQEGAAIKAEQIFNAYTDLHNTLGFEHYFFNLFTDNAEIEASETTSMSQKSSTSSSPISNTLDTTPPFTQEFWSSIAGFCDSPSIEILPAGAEPTHPTKSTSLTNPAIGSGENGLVYVEQGIQPNSPSMPKKRKHNYFFACAEVNQDSPSDESALKRQMAKLTMGSSNND